MSQIVIHGDTVYLAGQVGSPEDSIEGQTKDALAKIDSFLAEAGSCREKILQATIFLTDIDDFEAMNSVWDKWICTEYAPARACAEARLAIDGLRVEIVVVAAI
jgi:enamine deaminase RidA (YjgF/YER057c/UK114 family)